MMFKYVCPVDGAQMRQNRNFDIQSAEDEKEKKIHTKSLGTWKCPKCGEKKVKREKN